MNIFPNNNLCSAMLVDSSRFVFICGEHHNRYDDSDEERLIYDTEDRCFLYESWTTRFYCSGCTNRQCMDVNDCSEGVIQEITDAAKGEALAAIQKKGSGELVRNMMLQLRAMYPKSYSKKSLQEVETKLPEVIEGAISAVCDLPVAISLLYNSPYSGYDTGKYFSRFISLALGMTGVTVKDHLNTKPKKVKVTGNTYTGEVIRNEVYIGYYGSSQKIGIKVDGLEKSVWYYTNSNVPEVGETVTIDGEVKYEGERSITLAHAKRIDNISKELLISIEQ